MQNSKQPKSEGIIKVTTGRILSFAMLLFEIYESTNNVISSIYTIPITAVAGLINGLFYDEKISKDFYAVNKLLHYQRVYDIHAKLFSLKLFKEFFDPDSKYQDLVETSVNCKPLYKLILSEDDDDLKNIPEPAKKDIEEIKKLEHFERYVISKVMEIYKTAEKLNSEEGSLKEPLHKIILCDDDLKHIFESQINGIEEIKKLDYSERYVISKVMKKLNTEGRLSQQHSYKLFLDVFKNLNKKLLADPEKEIDKLIKDVLSFKSYTVNEINALIDKQELKLFKFCEKLSIQLKETLKNLIPFLIVSNRFGLLTLNIISLLVLVPIYILLLAQISIVSVFSFKSLSQASKLLKVLQPKKLFELFKIQKLIKLLSIGILYETVKSKALSSKEEKTLFSLQSRFNGILWNVNNSYSNEKFSGKNSVLQVLEKTIAEIMFKIRSLWNQKQNEEDFTQNVMIFAAEKLQKFEEALKAEKSQENNDEAEYHMSGLLDALSVFNVQTQDDVSKINKLKELARFNPVACMQAAPKFIEQTIKSVVVNAGKQTAMQAQTFCNFVKGNDDQKEVLSCG